MNKKDDTIRYDKWFILVATVLSALLGTGSGSYIYFRTADANLVQEFVRPDPATGSELKHLSESLSVHISKDDRLNSEVSGRIAVLEAQYRMILQNQQRILDRLDKI